MLHSNCMQGFCGCFFIWDWLWAADSETVCPSTLPLEVRSLSSLKVTIQIWQEQAQCPKENCHFEKQSSSFHRADCLQLHLEAFSEVAARSWLISRGTNEPALPEVSCALWFLTASLVNDWRPQMSLMQTAPFLHGPRHLMPAEKVVLSGAFILFLLIKMHRI